MSVAQEVYWVARRCSRGRELVRRKGEWVISSYNVYWGELGNGWE